MQLSKTLKVCRERILTSGEMISGNSYQDEATTFTRVATELETIFQGMRFNNIFSGKKITL